MDKLKKLYSIIDTELQNHAQLLEEAEEHNDITAVTELHGICGTYQNVLDMIVKLIEEE